MGHTDYPLHEFALRLANVEEKYAKEIQNLVECFSQSRVDLPVKRLEDMTKARLKTARHLKKSVDQNKNELVNLWKLCNIYSATAVDVDEAMREIRGSLRKRIKPVQKESAFKRFVDEYRPAKRTMEPPQEIYDVNKPTLKEKQRFRDMFKREKKEKQPLYDAEQSYTQHLVDTAKASLRENPETEAIPPPANKPPAPKKQLPPKPPTPQKPVFPVFPVNPPEPSSVAPKKSSDEVAAPIAAPRRSKSVAPADIRTVNIAPRLNGSENLEKSCTLPIAEKQTTLIKVNAIDDKVKEPAGVIAQQHNIRISDEDGNRPRITDGRIQRFHSHQQPAPQRQQAQIIVVATPDDNEISINRF